MESAFQSSENEADWQQVSPLLDAAISQLGETDRNAVLLRFFEKKNFCEVGVALGTNEEAAKKRVSRAVEKLRSFFVKRGTIFPATTLIGVLSANSVLAAPVGLSSTIASAAVLKGTVASASTLTLIKGTLKIMAWTKMKTAVVATAIVVAGAGTVWTASRMIQNHDPAGIPGLIGWWKLDGNGTEVKDHSQFFKGNHGKLIKGPTPTTSDGREH